MKKGLLLIGLLAVSFSLGGQEAMAIPEYRNGLELFMRLDMLNKFKDSISIGLGFIDESGSVSTHQIVFEHGDFMQEKYQRVIIAYTDDSFQEDWSGLIIYQSIIQEHDLNYEFVFGTQVFDTLLAFKEEIKVSLQDNFGEITLLAEGEDFLEYEVDGIRFYHGFMLAQGILPKEYTEGYVKKNRTTPLEFIGFSRVENYAERRELYVKTFENNRAMIHRVMRELGFDPDKINRGAGIIPKSDSGIS